jgi:predicted component of type VI protein secretion system
MRLVLRQKDGDAREFQFKDGSISIGRAADSQILLPDRAVSRKHAVIQSTSDGKWTVEDLDSASKTYLNDAAVHKAQIQHGDNIRITDFTIEVVLEEELETDESIHLEDTFHLEAALAIPPHETVVRKPDAGHALLRMVKGTQPPGNNCPPAPAIASLPLSSAYPSYTLSSPRRYDVPFLFQRSYEMLLTS